ncbi:MAG: ribosome-associated translation inhibitor RaiA [Zetaproteobacteria bacterium]|nr:MAG: ribosome-associated translation inhibitor RaiA [Zetaproteobacteria bacterium]
MNISITGRNVELTEPLKAYVHEKLGHLKHSFDYVVDVRVVLRVDRFRHYCEVTIQANNIVINASKETEDMYASIDGAIDKINRQLKRYRAKLRKHQKRGEGRRAGRRVAVSRKVLRPPADEELAEDHLPETVQHEVIHAEPMDVDEAVMRLELGEHNHLLVFNNITTNKLNILYRHGDGTISCLEPELE